MEPLDPWSHWTYGSTELHEVTGPYEATFTHQIRELTGFHGMDPLDPIDHWTQSVGLAPWSHRIASIGPGAQVASMTPVSLQILWNDSILWTYRILTGSRGLPGSRGVNESRNWKQPVASI